MVGHVAGVPALQLKLLLGEALDGGQPALPGLREAGHPPGRGVEPVGSYAYNIYFNHGCRNGIYTLEHLRELGEVVAGG